VSGFWEIQAAVPQEARCNAPHAASTARARLAPTVPARARALAAQLADLFEADQLIVVRLNDAHHQLVAANDRLWSDPATNPLGVGHEVHRAFCAYQHASEQRRQLAVDVGELSQRLADALTNAGYRPEQARSANVHDLAAGTWRPTEERER
jgi:hypothetical protein